MCLHGLPVLTLSHTANHTPVDDNLDNGFNASDWLIEASEPHALDDFANPLSTLELLEGWKYNLVYQLILATKASDYNSGYFGGDDGFLHRCHPQIPQLP